MSNTAIQAAVRSTLISSLIEKPKGYSEFEKGLVNRPMDFLQISHIAFKNMLISSLTKDIFVESFAGPGNSDPGAFLYLPDQELLSIANELGQNLKVSTSSRVKKEEGGYTISLPIFYDYKIDAENLLIMLGFSPNNVRFGESLAENKKKANNLLKKLLGNSGAFDLSKPVDVRFNTKDLLKESPWFKKESITTVSAKAYDTFETYVMGFRLVGPPGAKNYKYRLPVSVPTDERPEEDIISMDQVPEEHQDSFVQFSLGARKFTLYAELFIPEEFAEYMVQTPAEQITPSYIALWASLWVTGSYASKKSNLKPAEALTPITSIKIRNQEALKSDQVPARVNDKQLATLPDGTIVYVPNVDNVESYEQSFSDFAETDTGEYSLSDATKLPLNVYTYGETQEEKRQQSEKRLESNTVIYTDWINRKISYTDSIGLVRIMDLEGCAPTSPVAITNLIKTPVLKANTKNRKLISAVIYSIRHRLQVYGKSMADFYKEEDLVKFMPTYNRRYITVTQAIMDGDLQKLVNNVVGYLDSEQSINFGLDTKLVSEYKNVDRHTYALFHPDSPIPPYRPVGRALEFLKKQLEADTTKYISERAVENALMEIGTLISIVDYGGTKNLEKLEIAVAESQKPYTDPKLDKNHEPTPIPYIKDGVYMFPHQNRVDNILSNNTPKYTILDVDTGGGKTFIILKHLIELLDKGKAKKPLVICPGQLVKNYVEDNAFFFEGKVNIVCITSRTFKRHGEEYFRKLIKVAPPNTVYITDYSFVKSGSIKTFYGNAEQKISYNTELLRMFDFDVVAMDEAHYLRNDSTRTKATQRLVSDIGRVVLATGTLINNQLSDVCNIVSMVDPGIFGDKDDFKEEYAAEMVGSRVISWKPGAESKVRDIISNNTALVKVSSKEWAALLPYKNEKFHFIDMTEEQRAMYQSILEETIEQLKEVLASNKKAANLMKGIDKEEEGEDDDIDEEALEALLRPYLQRLEMFLTAPERDKAGSMVLKGEHRVGPKVKKIVEICKEHIKDDIPGKIIIFTSYNNSATSIYENLPADLQSKAVHYHAETKDKDLAQFTRNDNIKILIGIEESMREGLNLQMASRLIRVETIWNPGSLDQAEARINRPDPKNLAGGERDEIFLDWIAVDRSLDITKASRLISKILSKVKFDEQDNPKYDDLDSLPIISMSLENIIEVNDFDTNLRPYLDEYSTYKTIQREDYQEYKDNPKNKIVTLPVKSTGKGLPGEAYMPNVPYIYDMKIPLSDKLGLIPFSDYVNEHSQGESLEEFVADGLRVHTEYGDGVVQKTYQNSVRVKLDKGYAVNAKKLTVSILSKKLDKPVYEKIAEYTDMPINDALAVSKKVLKKEQKIREQREKKKQLRQIQRKPKKPIPNEDLEENLQVNAYFTIINGMVAVGIDNEPDVDEKVMKKLNFNFSSPYIYTHIKNYRVMDQFIDKMIENFDMRQKYLDVMEELLEAFTSGKKRLLNAERALQVKIRNFYLARMRRVKRGWLRPYPVIQDGELFICLTTSNQPSAIEVPRKVRVPTVRWEKSDGEWMYFAKDKADAKNKIKELMDSGINVQNLEQLKKEYKEIRVTKKKSRSRR